MKNRIKLAFVGGGSYAWAPGLIRDIILSKDLNGFDIYLLDRNMKNAKLVKQLMEKMNSDQGKDYKFVATESEEEALDGCHFVIICISTGGLAAMSHDITIPEKYGIYMPVGDTVGPGGWSRNMRNVPVFNALADKIAKLSDDAVVLNYTNPMACLTQSFYVRTQLRTVGLCHGLATNYKVLGKIFGVDTDRIHVRIAGVNHFFWMLDFKVDGKDGYALLRERLGSNKRFKDLIREVDDEFSFKTKMNLASVMFDEYGYLPFVADRHTSEFLSHVVTGKENRLVKYLIKRSTIEDRADMADNRLRRLNRMIIGEESIKYSRSNETAVDIIEAFVLGKDFVTVINVPNTGQISNLPLGGVVETMGVVNPLGFTPLTSGPLPEPLRRLTLPHVENSNMIYEAATNGDLGLALEALRNDPVCAYLDYRDIRNMAEELLKANRDYLPQFIHSS